MHYFVDKKLPTSPGYNEPKSLVSSENSFLGVLQMLKSNTKPHPLQVISSPESGSTKHKSVD